MKQVVTLLWWLFKLNATRQQICFRTCTNNWLHTWRTHSLIFEKVYKWLTYFCRLFVYFCNFCILFRKSIETSVNHLSTLPKWVSVYENALTASAHSLNDKTIESAGLRNFQKDRRFDPVAGCCVPTSSGFVCLSNSCLKFDLN